MVGAHVEEVTPRRIVLSADRSYLLIVIGVSILLHAWLIFHTFATARDSIRFARTALNLESPNQADENGMRTFADVLRDAKLCPDPPGFPLAVLGVSKIVRMTSGAPLPEQMLLSAQIASSLAAVLLVFPSYWLGRMLFANPFAGFAAALLFQVLPTAAHITADGLSDSLSLLFILSTLVCSVRAVRTWSTKWFVAAGLAGGCGYLVRPEGAIGVLAIAAVLAGLMLTRRLPLRTGLGRGCGLLAGFLIVAVPYMALIGGVSNKPTVNEQLRKLIPARLLLKENAAAPFPALFAEWYSGQGSQSLWAAKAIVKETAKTSHYLPFGLGLLGLIWFRQRFDASFAVVLVALALQLLLLFVLGMKPMPANLGPGVEAVPPYVSERHTLLLAYFACLFTGGLLAAIETRLFAAGVLIALVASALPGAVKPLHENRAGHLHAGRFLADKLGPNDAVIDPFEWAQWHSGRSLYGVPADPKENELNARWVVWEPTAGTRQNPHSRLPRLEMARNVVEDRSNPPTLVYQWPENVPADAAKVVVYRQIVAKKN